MDIYTYLKKDHKKVSQLFERIMVSPNSLSNQSIFENIQHELFLHAHSEQETFYNALKKNTAGKEEILQAMTDHQEIENILVEMNKLKFMSPEWLILLGELKSVVEHHVNDEETNIFDLAKKYLSKAEARNLAIEMDEKKQEMLHEVT